MALPLSGSNSAMLVPSNVLLFRPEGTRVAVVGSDGKVKLRTVTLGHDLGNKLEILSGIGTADKLVINPADSLADGDVVQVRAPKAVAGPGASAADPSQKAAQ